MRTPARRPPTGAPAAEATADASAPETDDSGEATNASEDES